MEISSEIKSFLSEWDNYYNSLISDISLFKQEKIKTLTKEQVQFFIRAFYHVRGHFHEFLFFLANFAPNKKCKEMVLRNIMDELGIDGVSHEKLYHIFAEQFGVELAISEMIKQETNLEFIKKFNSDYILALVNKDWNFKCAAFAALERLDNADYSNTKKVAEVLGATGIGLTFFNVHMNSKHFESVSECFIDSWNEDKESCKVAFDLVAQHQSKMWRDLSKAVFN